MTTTIYRGRLEWTSNGEESNLLGIVFEEPSRADAILAECIQDDLGELGRTVTVRYWLSSIPRTAEELQHDLTVISIGGELKVQYWMHYSDITGYLYTDEKLRVGGHDLLAELSGGVGMWLHLEIDHEGR